MSEKRFQFRLDPLIRKQEWDVELLKRSVAEAQALMTQRSAACQQVVEEVVKLEDEIRVTMSAEFSVARYQSLSSYLSLTRSVLAEKTAELTTAERALNEALENLLEGQQSLAALEKRRERKKQLHDNAAIRMEYKTVDDNWVLRAGRDKR